MLRRHLELSIALTVLTNLICSNYLIYLPYIFWPMDYLAMYWVIFHCLHIFLIFFHHCNWLLGWISVIREHTLSDVHLLCLLEIVLQLRIQSIWGDVLWAYQRLWSRWCWLGCSTNVSSNLLVEDFRVSVLSSFLPGFSANCPVRMWISSLSLTMGYSNCTSFSLVHFSALSLSGCVFILRFYMVW